MHPAPAISEIQARLLRLSSVVERAPISESERRSIPASSLIPAAIRHHRDIRACGDELLRANHWEFDSGWLAVRLLPSRGILGSVGPQFDYLIELFGIIHTLKDAGCDIRLPRKNFLTQIGAVESARGLEFDASDINTIGASITLSAEERVELGRLVERMVALLQKFSSDANSPFEAFAAAIYEKDLVALKNGEHHSEFRFLGKEYWCGMGSIPDSVFLSSGSFPTASFVARDYHLLRWATLYLYARNGVFYGPYRRELHLQSGL